MCLRAWTGALCFKRLVWSKIGLVSVHENVILEILDAEIIRYIWIKLGTNVGRKTRFQVASKST